jgi:glycosyltransferase involved in cell wall biosynthesis
MSTGCPVFIIENPPFRELTSLYGRAKIFWSAAGYDIDEKKDPQKMEHFGMAVVESMAGGAVPLIFSGGGHNEIVKNKVNGLLWNKKSDLVRDTLEVIKNKNQYDILSKNAVKLADGFGYEKFKENIKEIIK